MTMTEHERLVRCENCATVWALDSTPDGRCPVCHLAHDGAEGGPSPVSSVGDLEAHLAALVRDALRGGVSPSEIVGALRDELTFAVELGQDGRRFTVALIDLGPQEADLQRRAPQLDGGLGQRWLSRRSGG